MTPRPAPRSRPSRQGPRCARCLSCAICRLQALPSCTSALPPPPTALAPGCRRSRVVAGLRTSASTDPKRRRLTARGSPAISRPSTDLAFALTKRSSLDRADDNGQDVSFDQRPGLVGTIVAFVERWASATAWSASAATAAFVVKVFAQRSACATRLPVRMLDTEVGVTAEMLVPRGATTARRSERSSVSETGLWGEGRAAVGIGAWPPDPRLSGHHQWAAVARLCVLVFGCDVRA